MNNNTTALLFLNIHIHSYVGVTIGPISKYQSEPFDRAKELRKVEYNITCMHIDIHNLNVMLSLYTLTFLYTCAHAWYLQSDEYANINFSYSIVELVYFYT